MSHSKTWRELILFNFRLDVDYVTQKKSLFSLANQLGNIFLLFSVLMFTSNYRSALYSLSSSVRYDLSLPSAKKAKDLFFLSQLSMSIYFLFIEFFLFNRSLSLSVESIMRCLYSFSRFSLIYLYFVSFLEIFLILSVSVSSPNNQNKKFLFILTIIKLFCTSVDVNFFGLQVCLPRWMENFLYSSLLVTIEYTAKYTWREDETLKFFFLLFLHTLFAIFPNVRQLDAEFSSSFLCDGYCKIFLTLFIGPLRRSL